MWLLTHCHPLTRPGLPYPSGPWLSLLESPGLGGTVPRPWPPPTRSQGCQSRTLGSAFRDTPHLLNRPGGPVPPRFALGTWSVSTGMPLSL